MSTIASPRDSSLRRTTPSSSARPSTESHRSSTTTTITSPTPNHHQSQSVPPAPPPKRSTNRAALRDFYKLKAIPTSTTQPPTPRIELPDSEVDPSAIDDPDFDPSAYIAKISAESSLEDLLRTYTTILGEIRALDAEKKALVYDNYSKLITATETIRKMRASMDPLNPMASTLDPAIAQIYSQASSIRETLRDSIPPPDSEQDKERKDNQRKVRTRELAILVLNTPKRLRALVAEGKISEAKSEWEDPRRLLVSWKEKGLGGDDVQACINEGDAALRPRQSTDSARPSKDGP